MPGTVTLRVESGIAVVTLDNPPVNGLGTDVRTGLQKQLAAATADPAVEAVVLCGAGRMFSGGADIREFGQSSLEPHLSTVVAAIEDSPKLVVAAIHGVAAGGGLEVALGCHYRLAEAGTKVGLPEVTLGIVPGAGGTQRLPRLIGVEHALELIVGGSLIDAGNAHTLGLVDEIIEGDLLPQAVSYARRLITQRSVIRRTGTLDAALFGPRADGSVFERFRAKMAKRARGFDAPYAAVACIEAAVSQPFKKGLATERKTFETLLASDQSKAQRHVFFAEREALKVPDVPRDTPTMPIAKAAVIGCGTMGGGIAMTFANAGIPVTVVEVSQDALDAGFDVVTRNYDATVSKGRLSHAERDERLGRIARTTSYDEIAESDIVIEAVPEQMELKKEVFRTLDAKCKPGAVLATNTSTLDVDEIAAVTTRPESVVGTHFFSPANVMRLMENVRGAKTSPQTIATVMQLSKRLGKVGVLVGVCDGFVGNRMLAAYLRQADFLLEEGALPEQIDRAIYNFGLAMGPYQMSDMAGLDVSWFIRQRQADSRPKDLRYSFLADRICELGRFGQKTGAGWYRYDAGTRTPIPDPLVTSLIETVSEERGITRQPVSDTDIIIRCLYPLVNEGAKLLEEGIALRAGDIDIVWVYGYGFPRYRGGPMFWADLVGLRTIHEAMQRLHDNHGEWLAPAPLLAELAKEGRTFGEM